MKRLDRKYFWSSFTRKEQIGVVVLSGFLVIFFSLRLFFSYFDHPPSTLEVVAISSNLSNDISTISHEINTMKNDDFQHICGLSQSTSEKIIEYRMALGGFYSIDQIAEAIIIPDSVLASWKKILHCDKAKIKMFRLHPSHLYHLEQHPYIGKALAHLLLRIKEKQIEKNIPTYLEKFVAKEKINKIKSYLIFE